MIRCCSVESVRCSVYCCQCSVIFSDFQFSVSSSVLLPCLLSVAVISNLCHSSLCPGDVDQALGVAIACCPGCRALIGTRIPGVVVYKPLGVAIEAESDVIGALEVATCRRGSHQHPKKKGQLDRVWARGSQPQHWVTRYPRQEQSEGAGLKRVRCRGYEKRAS